MIRDCKRYMQTRVRQAASAIYMVLLTACSTQLVLPTPEAKDPVHAAFVALGPGGTAVARVITSSPTCPDLEVDAARVAMTLRAAPATLPLRPTISGQAASKPPAFPVTTCEAPVPPRARSASVGGHALPLPKPTPQRIVVIGDSGCRLKLSDGAFQRCNDPAEWPFAQIAGVAAKMRPDLVIHVGDYHYRENACPVGEAGCAASPWGYGWDTWDADFFTPARDLLAAAPWIFVRGNHESCNRAGQGWWRFLDPGSLEPRRDCNDAADDGIGDYSEPYAVPLGDTQFIVFDSSKAVIPPLSPGDSMYRTYTDQMQSVFVLARGVEYNFFLDHHPILGFAPNPTQHPTGLYPGNQALQSVLAPLTARRLFPQNIAALIAGHYHLFEMVSFGTSQPVQLISGNAGAWTDAPLPVAVARTAEPAPGAIIESIVSTSKFGFMIIERRPAATWLIQALDVRGQPFTTCTLRDAKARCEPETLP